MGEFSKLVKNIDNEQRGLSGRASDASKSAKQWVVGGLTRLGRLTLGLPGAMLCGYATLGPAKILIASSMKLLHMGTVTANEILMKTEFAGFKVGEALSNTDPAYLMGFSLLATGLCAKMTMDCVEYAFGNKKEEKPKRKLSKYR